MKIRKFVFLMTIAGSAALLYALWPQDNLTAQPLALTETEHGIIVRYDAPLILETMLAIPASATLCRIIFNNNRQLVYTNGAAGCDNQSAGLLRWQDASGRLHAAPRIQLPLPEPNSDGNYILPLGLDYETYVSALNDRLRIVSLEIDGVAPVAPQFFARTASAASPGTGAFRLALRVDLGRIAHPAVINDAHVQIWEEIASPTNDSYLAISSYDQSFYRIDGQTGAQQWRFRIANGKGSSIAICPDARVIIGGERSADGNLYALDADSGQLLWKAATAAIIGGIHDSLPGEGLFADNIKPTVRDISVTPQRTVLARASRIRRIAGDTGNVQRERRAVLICHDIDSGRKLWQYPPATIITNVQTSQMHTSADGRYFSIARFDPDGAGAATITIHSTSDGRILWQDEIFPDSVHFKTVCAYAGISLSADGAWAAVPLQDGRIFLYDNEKSVATGQPVRKNIIDACRPIDAGAVPIMTHMRPVLFTASHQMIVVSGNTFATAAAYGAIPPLDHPDANSVFAYDLGGELLWRFTLEGNCSYVSYSRRGDRELLAVTTAHNIRSRDPAAHGVHLFDLSPGLTGSERLLSVYKTNGICVNARITTNAERLWIIEVPIDMDPSRRIDIHGQHRLHCFEVPQ